SPIGPEWAAHHRPSRSCQLPLVQADTNFCKGTPPTAIASQVNRVRTLFRGCVRVAFGIPEKSSFNRWHARRVVGGIQWWWADTLCSARRAGSDAHPDPSAHASPQLRLQVRE